MRLIDEDVLKEALMMYTWRDEDDFIIDDADAKRKFIDEWMPNVPTVEAEPVRRGKWLECEDGWGDTHYQCSECGGEWYLEAGTPEENNMNFCPHCGAKMEVEE